MSPSTTDSMRISSPSSSPSNTVTRPTGNGNQTLSTTGDSSAYARQTARSIAAPSGRSLSSHSSASSSVRRSSPIPAAELERGLAPDPAVLPPRDPALLDGIAPPTGLAGSRGLGPGIAEGATGTCARPPDDVGRAASRPRDDARPLSPGA